MHNQQPEETTQEGNDSLKTQVEYETPEVDWDDIKCPMWRKIGVGFIDWIIMPMTLVAFCYLLFHLIGADDLIREINSIHIIELLFYVFLGIGYNYLCSEIADRSIGDIIFGSIRLGSDNDLENVSYNNRRYRARYEMFKRLGIPGHKKNEKTVVILSIAILLLTILGFWFVNRQSSTVENDYFRVSAKNGFEALAISQYEPVSYSVALGKDPNSMMTVSALNFDIGDLPLENLVFNQIANNNLFQNLDTVMYRDTTFLSYKAIVADIILVDGDSYKTIVFRNNNNMAFSSIIHNVSQQQIQKLSQGIEIKNTIPQYADLETFMRISYGSLSLEINQPISEDMVLKSYGVEPETKSFKSTLQIISAAKDDISKEAVHT